MPESHFAAISEGLSAHRPKNMKELMGCISLMQPMLDAIPNAVIFVKDAQARYLMANRTLVERCGLKSLAPLLGRTSAQVFPAQLGPGYTEQDRRVLEGALVLQDQLEVHLYGTQQPGWCLTHKRPILNRQGEVMGLIGISVDLQSAAQAHPAYQRLSAVDAYIREHYHRPITLDDLTAVAGLSVAQLERYCKRIFHLTPRQMIHKARLEQAHLLLHSELPITEVALRCGYSDHSAFSRQFKTMTGFTPRQYRQATRG
ncbi:AraC family transcriptional regulator [Pseudomonas guariconensis]|nr:MULTISPECIES: AraC family transcriptional regulator [Pseudomonas]MBF8722090.1 AraC family transcriptional regulator [Pseudomonas guariconensis]UBM24133.1 AraC family transcriptional regulator [Pseudomonas sp. p1(2021b)]